ncbi:electron transfer flavoprotein subunit beta [Endozoicomonas sp. OPT23]|uniref:electron transfer flavoprotein subunit beta n=1 Tax=Endozoicomonas sp. OPT23 TaxID=2072845 RepID=UPI00129AFB3C|nr:electron transfer flavoprotein subunit beta [Endozoicomonas sp. OPT23]MRI33161.1 electron transfer flavoprotein subunit beta [Endozoicomonas sp. OPT23]
MQPDLKLVSLLSTGRHPKSGRACRANQDSRALELAMKTSSQVTAVHAGNPDNNVLRQYAGMGLKKIAVLDLPETADPTQSLKHYLDEQSPDIVLTGVRAEDGESSGMLPYLLSEKLGWAMVPRIAEIQSIENGKAKVLQALPRGQRRLIEVDLPFIASVDNSAAEPRQSAFGPASRATIETISTEIFTDEALAGWQLSAARKRPKRLKIAKAKTAADRFKAATAKSQSKGGTLIKDKPASEQAKAIFDLLVTESVIKQP